MSLPFNHLSYLSQTFVQYKTLLEDWSNYIDKLYENDHDTSFTPDMESNIFVDFTRLINVDMKTFIIAMAGNCHTRQKQRPCTFGQSIWYTNCPVNFSFFW